MKIAEVTELLGAKTGASGDTFTLRMKRAKRRFPRKIRQQARIVSEAESMLENPRLAHTVTGAQYDSAIRDIRLHLHGINLKEERRGWWLGVLGGMAFNLLAAIILFIAALRLFDLI